LQILIITCLHYIYDANGNQLTVGDKAGTINREYDQLNRVTKLTDVNDNVIQYEYNKVGDITTITYPDGKKVNYTYDKSRQMTSVTDWAGRATKYSYDANKRLVKTIRPNGSVLTQTYNTKGQMTQKKDISATGKVISQTKYTYDQNGNVIKEEEGGESDGEADPATTVKYGDLNGDKVINSIDLALMKRYLFGVVSSFPSADGLKAADLNGDGVINTIDYSLMKRFTSGLISNFPVQSNAIKIENMSMKYDTNNRVSNVNGKAVTYDADGNMINGPLGFDFGNYSFDSKNRLISTNGRQSQSVNQSVYTQYVYDAENNRIGQIQDGKQTSYVINPEAALSQVLVKTNPDGKKTYYVYGLGLIGQEDESGNYLTYHYDQRGSTIALTDISGNIVNRFKYSAYGELVSATDANGNTVANAVYGLNKITNITPLLFNGRDGVMTDNNGLYYMRARYYNPKIKRFVNEDIIKGDISDGRTLNRYAYVNGNPVSLIDPFGLSPNDGNEDEMKTLNLLKEYFGKFTFSLSWGVEGGCGLGAGANGGIVIDDTLLNEIIKSQGDIKQINLKKMAKHFMVYGTAEFGATTPAGGVSPQITITNAKSLSDTEGWGVNIGGSARISKVGIYLSYVGPLNPKRGHEYGGITVGFPNTVKLPDKRPLPAEFHGYITYTKDFGHPTYKITEKFVKLTYNACKKIAKLIKDNLHI
jgi:RHS repeat-associated protein